MSQEKVGLPAMKSDIFGFVEKEDVPYAIEKLSGDMKLSCGLRTN
jgi:hypothetical protein